MTEIFMTENISEKIKQLDNSGDKTLLKKIIFIVHRMKNEDHRRQAKKVLQTENIYFIKINNLYRLFYTIEKDKNNEEIILLLDIAKKTNFKSDLSKVVKTLNGYKDKRE